MNLQVLIMAVVSKTDIGKKIPKYFKFVKSVKLQFHAYTSFLRKLWVVYNITTLCRDFKIWFCIQIVQLGVKKNHFSQKNKNKKRPFSPKTNDFGICQSSTFKLCY